MMLAVTLAVCAALAGAVALPTDPTSHWESVRNTNSTAKRYVAYWSVWAQGLNLPTSDQLEGVTHVVLSFVDMDTFSGFWEAYSNPNPFTTETVSSVRSACNGCKVMAAFGGWNLDQDFRTFSATDDSRTQFASKVKSFLDSYNLDGADIDWEYPVWNSANYLTTEPRNDADKTNFPLMLAALRSAMPDKLISIALPSRHVDMIAYDTDSISQIDPSVDWYNLMAYDQINRRDNETNYQAGDVVVLDSIDTYGAMGMDKTKMNIGFPMYAKWFWLNSTDAALCTANPPIGCPMGGYEDPSNGADTGLSGTWVWNTDPSAQINVVPTATNGNSVQGIQASFDALPTDGSASSPDKLASAYFDKTYSLFWTWVSPSDIQQTCEKRIGEVGGVMVWSLNQDQNGAAGGPHLQALAQCMSSA